MDAPRTIEPRIHQDLAEKMVFLAGPRQVGKTTVARHLLAAERAGLYYTWDKRSDRREILDAEWPTEPSLIVLDELHKYRGWKRWIKGEFDAHRERHRFLVTGSARMDVYRRGGDSLQGRYHHHRLHPFTVGELRGRGDPLPQPGATIEPRSVGAREDLESLMTFGGFPAPFLAQSERGLMRQRFLDSLVNDQHPAEVHLSSDQLIAWQRDLPTTKSEPHASVSTLKGLLLETTAKDAYRVMADHLGMNADLPTLSWVLGALTVQVRQRFHDPDRRLLHVLLGTVACERLATHAQPEHLATLITQLGHQLWWTIHHAKLSPVRTCIDPATPDFAEAVASGNLTAAQRAARALAKNPAAFWEQAWKMVEERIQANDPHWYVALELVLVVAWRTSTDAVSPDDAAAVGTVLADLAYREKTTPELAAQ